MTRHAFWLSIVLALTLALPAGLALAHGQSVQTDQLTYNPGDPIVVIGNDLGSQQAVPVHLIARDGTQVDLGTATTDADGSFVVPFSVPTGLGSGVYQLHAAANEPAVSTIGIGIDPSQVPTSPADNDGD